MWNPGSYNRLELLSFRPSPFRVAVDVRKDQHELFLRFGVEGPVSNLRYSSPSGFGNFQENLWKSTCFECFVKDPCGETYEEWNFSPLGPWWHSGFLDYRKKNSKIPRPNVPDVQVQEFKEKIYMIIQMPVPTRALVGLNAILETKSGPSYWALRHAKKKPDFHSPANFRLLI